MSINYAEINSPVALELYRKNGYIIITNVFADNECRGIFGELLGNFQSMGTDLAIWDKLTLPPQTRYGLFQALVGHLPPVWQLRCDSRIRNIFKTFYSALRGRDIDDFICSFDGVNVQPNKSHYPKSANYLDAKYDWPHIDQIGDHDIYRWVQGQVVLTDSSAAFRCTPGSHLLYKDILELCGIDIAAKSPTNFLKFNEEQISNIKKLTEKNNLTWQTEIKAPRGSVILWTSATIHSATYVNRVLDNTGDEYRGWRGVVYVSYSPRCELTAAQLKRHKNYYESGRMTGHTGTKLMEKVPNGRYIKKDTYSKQIQELLDEPSRIFELCGRPANEDEVAKLI